MKLCITGGGTGGHLAIARSLAQAARKQNVRTYYIGSTNGQDRAYFEHSELFLRTYFLATSGVVDKKGAARFIALTKIFKAFLYARTLLRRHKIDALYSVGGYSAAAASFAAISLRIPLFIHEQNAHTGTLNAILRPFATQFVSAYDPDSPISGYPVADDFFDAARIRSSVRSVIFLGGSQGARAINDLAMEVAPILRQKGIAIIHQTGKSDLNRVRDFYRKNAISADVFDFSNSIVEKITRADLAVSRSGAGTVWELCANALPALFIPYPYAAGDHQYQNAAFLARRELAWVVRQGEGEKETLLRILDTDLREKSEKLADLNQKGVADAMIAAVKEKVFS